MLMFTQVVSAQVARRTENSVPRGTRAESATPAVPAMSVRAQAFYENTNMTPVESQWSRTIYRELDLTKGPNASLFFPEDPIDGQTNLFRLILNLISENHINAYEYLDDREIFTEKFELNTKDMLDKFYIVYEEKPGKGARSASQYVIDENDVPAGEVMSYYIKEKWEFDQRSAQLVSSVEAICPILHRTGDFGGDVTKYPMFWIKYENIRPYLSQHLIMSDGVNNTKRFTFEDFFVLRQYDGDIYKTMNLQNKSLMQLYPNEDSLQLARTRIEAELKGFEESLWIPTPSMIEAKATAKKKQTLVATSVTPDSIPVNIIVEEPVIERSTRRTNPRVVKTKEEKAAEKAEKSSSRAVAAPARSVRRTR